MQLPSPGDCPQYLVDTSAIIGLACCDVAELVLDSTSFTITNNCYKELRDKPTDSGLNRTEQDAAEVALDYFDNDAAHKRTVIPGSPSYSRRNGGERSIIHAIKNYSHFRWVMIFDTDAVAMIENTTSTHNLNVDTVTPNDPLFDMARTSTLSNSEFCEYSAQILDSRNWRGSTGSNKFWENYPIDCRDYR